MARNCAVIIGINDYYEISPLKYSKRDAEKVRDFFIQDLGVSHEDLYFFTDDSPRNAQGRKTQPTYGTLKSFLGERFAAPFLSAGDTLWFYFSGHGMPCEGRDYLLPSDGNPRTMPALGIAISDVTKCFRQSGADNVVMLIDACRSYGTKSAGMGIGEERQQGVIMFFSCSPSQVSYEIDEIGQGAFTNVLLEALRIQGEGNCATVERFANYLKFRVPKLTQRYKNYPQTPYVVIEPETKLHYILLPKFANLTDITLLKVDALHAEEEGDFGLAFQLWMRVNVAASGTDMNAINAFSRLASKSLNSSSNSKTQEVYITPNNQENKSVSQDSPKTDITLLKVDALHAEEEGNFGLAFQLWMRVNVTASGTDMSAINAFFRLASKSSNSSSDSKTQEVYITPNNQENKSVSQDSPKNEGKRLNEAKIILVGHGGVGKTSLIKQLIDKDFKSDENKTEGIDIRHWIVKTHEESIRLRVWDFGGQEIMHATHQFFLTERSLYLLVLNARKDEGNNDIEYWLKIIESFGKDSPVLVIANKSDEHALKLNRRHLQDKYPNIQDFFFTSCKTGEGIDLLRTAIIQQIAAMDHVFNIFPLQWFRVKEIIERIDNDYIAYSEYENLCSTEGIISSEERKSLIRLLHLLGIVLNFAEDTRLQDTSVLNPEWVTGGVYRILNDNQLITKHKGMLNWQDLTRILTPKNKGDRNCYQENRDRQFILDMMQKFELCFPLDANSQNPIYLIPELLDEEEPDTGTWENTLNLEYHYKILFSSVISRFIVKMHHRISKRTYWRTGVILTFPEDNRAYIKADLADAKIFIRIDGNPNTRRSSLAAIRNNFESIHHSISALEVDERVPLPDNPKVTVSYEHLINLEKRGKTDYSPEGSDRDYNICELLDGIEHRETHRGNYIANQVIYNQYGQGDNFAGDEVEGNKIG